MTSWTPDGDPGAAAYTPPAAPSSAYTGDPDPEPYGPDLLQEGHFETVPTPWTLVEDAAIVTSPVYERTRSLYLKATVGQPGGPTESQAYIAVSPVAGRTYRPQLWVNAILLDGVNRHPQLRVDYSRSGAGGPWITLDTWGFGQFGVGVWELKISDGALNLPDTATHFRIRGWYDGFGAEFLASEWWVDLVELLRVPTTPAADYTQDTDPPTTWS